MKEIAERTAEGKRDPKGRTGARSELQKATTQRRTSGARERLASRQMSGRAGGRKAGEGTGAGTHILVLQPEGDPYEYKSKARI